MSETETLYPKEFFLRQSFFTFGNQSFFPLFFIEEKKHFLCKKKLWSQGEKAFVAGALKKFCLKNRTFVFEKTLSQKRRERNAKKNSLSGWKLFKNLFLGSSLEKL